MKYLESPIFYMGNKYKLLKEIIPLFPKECNTFLDLFGGSGVVSMNYKGKEKTIYNEFNDNIVNLVKLFKNNNVEKLDSYFNEKIKQFNICSTGKDFRKNMELQKGYYNFRDYYNKSKNKDVRDLYLLICYSMNHLIRFNKKNEFNASCGSTQKYIKEKIVNMNECFKNVEISNKNCFDIDFKKKKKGDFVYCDPPYSHSQSILYGGQDFSLDELLDEIARAKSKGVFVALSIDGSKKSGYVECNLPIPKGLFEREVWVNVGHSMLRRFQLEGQTLRHEQVQDRLLLTY